MNECQWCGKDSEHPLCDECTERGSPPRYEEPDLSELDHQIDVMMLGSLMDFNEKPPKK